MDEEQKRLKKLQNDIYYELNRERILTKKKHESKEWAERKIQLKQMVANRWK